MHDTSLIVKPNTQLNQVEENILLDASQHLSHPLVRPDWVRQMVTMSTDHNDTECDSSDFVEVRDSPERDISSLCAMG